MGLRKALNNFTGGEISPQLDARVDLQKYGNSLRTLKNFRPLPWGGAAFRAGTQYIAAVKTLTKKTRLIPFNFNTTTTYILELGDTYMRFYTGGAQVMSGMSPYEISTPFLEAELFELQFKEINDVLYIVHPLHAPQKLTRVSNASWTLAAVSWKYPALRDENTDGSTTLALGALTGSTTLTASAAMFASTHVGAYFEVRHLRASPTPSQIALSGTSGVVTGSGVEVVGDWQVTTTERWYGTLQIQRSIDGGSSWVVARQFTSKSDRNVSVSGTEDPPAVGKPRTQLRLVFTAAGNPYGTPPWVGSVPSSYVLATATLEVADAYIAALVKCTAYVSTTVLTVTILNAPASTDASTIWSEGAWSDYRGYPRAIGLYEQRLLFAGTTDKPNTLWGSVAADFENFQYSDLDDGAVAYQFADTEQNPIQWIGSLLRIHAGTTGSEYMVSSGNTDEPMTPSNVTVRRQSTYGGDFQPGLLVDNAILFVQRQGKRLRELREMSIYANPEEFQSQDLTLLAEHIGAAGITQMDYARLPDPTVYAVLASGELGVMTYNRDQNINAWSRYVTDGTFESVAAIYGSPSDVVYCVVKRTINGSTKRYVEVFTAESTNKTTGIYMDCSLTYNSTPVNVVTGLSHLEAKRVAVVADGQAIGNAYTGTGALTVASGQITLPNGMTASVVNVGLAYDGQLKPMKVDMESQDGPTIGRNRRISSVVARFKDTLGGLYGNSLTDSPSTGLYSAAIPFRVTADPMDAAPPLYTGDVQLIPWEGGNDLAGDILIGQTDPMPMTVLGLFADFEVTGK